MFLSAFGVFQGFREKDSLLNGFGSGILVGQLKEMRGPLPPCPQKLVQGNRRFKVRRNGNVDAAVVDVKRDVARIIFEVKTSSILSEQLYSAIGQLFYYRHKYGDANSHLFLVLPSECIGSNFISQGLFKRLGIAIIVRKKERFETFEGRPLVELVRSRLRA